MKKILLSIFLSTIFSKRSMRRRLVSYMNL